MEAWRVFAGYGLEAPLGYCGCDVCLTDAQELEVVSTPIRKLPSDMFLVMSCSVVIDTKEEHAKALLPRAIELLAYGKSIASWDNELPFMDPWDWRKWKKKEVAVIEEFCAAWLEYGLSLSPRGYNCVDLETLIITLEKLGFAWREPLRNRIFDGTTEGLSTLLGFANFLVGGEFGEFGSLKEFGPALKYLNELIQSDQTLEALSNAVLVEETEPRAQAWFSALHDYLSTRAPGYFSPREYGLE